MLVITPSALPSTLFSQATLVIAFACSMVLIGGCHSQPQLHVVNHSRGEHSDSAERLELNVTLSNPAKVDESRAGAGNTVRVMEIHYDVALDGRAVYEGRRDARMTLAPGDTRTIVLPVILSAGEMPSEPAPYRLTGTVLYLTDDRLSVILADLGFGYQRTSFAQEGELAQK